MKSLILKSPGQLELSEREIPGISSSEVLLKVKAAAICHTDFVVMNGQHTWATYPCILGHEFSGIVEEAGGSVANVKKGDRVTAISYIYCGYCSACRKGMHNACTSVRGIPFHMEGAFQEMMAVPSLMLYKFSDRLSFEEASITECAANGYSAVDRACIEQGDKVVIIGPGPVGLFALQFAALKQPEALIMLGTRQERLKMASSLGATHVVNVREEDPYKKVMDITNGYGADAVIFCGGGPDAWQLAESMLASYGRVIMEALPDRADEKWPVTVFKFTEKSIGFLGVSGYNGSQFEKALSLMENGKVSVSPLITHTFPLEEYKQAFETSEKRISGAIKVVFNSFQ